MSGYESGQVSSLGGGIPGARHGIGFTNTTFGADVSMQRKILRKAFKSNTVKYVDNSGAVQILGRSMSGPFRTAFNQGDVLTRKAQSCGGCNQVNDVNSGKLRPKMADGVSKKDCGTVTCGVTPSQVPLGSGNRNYVSDSSLYTKYRQLSAVNRNYNDSSFGGDANNGSYTFLRRVRNS
jgi:hypothetical protein